MQKPALDAMVGIARLRYADDELSVLPAAIACFHHLPPENAKGKNEIASLQGG
jgi:hypothetical protein